MIELGLEPGKSGSKAQSQLTWLLISFILWWISCLVTPSTTSLGHRDPKRQNSHPILLYERPPFTSLICTLGLRKISHCDDCSIMWFDQQKHWYTKEETRADFCISFYFCCVLLLFDNKREETEPEHSSAARIFYYEGLENKMSFNFFQFYFNFASGHLCSWAWKPCITQLTLSNNFLLIISSNSVEKRGGQTWIKYHMTILSQFYVANWHFSFSIKIRGRKKNDSIGKAAG